MELENSSYEMITILGPTASGKTSRAVALARELGSSVISGDSRQIYRGMDLGTGKDLEEYGDVPYSLIDIAEAGEKYNLFKYLQAFEEVFNRLRMQNVLPVFCGGSGMYLETVLSGIRLPEVPANKELRSELEQKSLEELTKILSDYKTLHNKTDIDNKKRAIRAIEIEQFYQNHPEAALLSKKENDKKRRSLIIGIDIPRDLRRERISRRLKDRLNAGMIDEVKSLIDKGVDPDILIYYGLEYKFLTLYLLGRLEKDEMTRLLEIAIHQFAKRQMTWFRGMEKRGFKINWIPFDIEEKEFNEIVKSLLYH